MSMIAGEIRVAFGESLGSPDRAEDEPVAEADKRWTAQGEAHMQARTITRLRKQLRATIVPPTPRTLVPSLRLFLGTRGAVRVSILYAKRTSFSACFSISNTIYFVRGF